MGCQHFVFKIQAFMPRAVDRILGTLAQDLEPYSSMEKLLIDWVI